MTTYGLWAALVLAFVQPAVAQTSGYLAGTVTDDSTHRPIAYASILAQDSFLGTAADENGRYVLELPPGRHTIRAQAVGYASAERSVTVAAGDTAHLSLELAPTAVQLGTITVEEEALSEQPSLYRLTPESIQSAPALGEPDIVRAAARLPGITQANDTKASLNVWGGASDQNKYLLDGIPVYSSGHVGGVFSAFNPKALGGAEIYPGNFPARYGGRLSSIIALRTKSEPDTSLARAHISLLSTSVGTAKKFGNTFVTAAARRTYLDPVMIVARMDMRYNFHDANLKVIQDLGKGYRAELIGFTNRDYLANGISRHREEPNRLFRWGNYLGALRLRRDGRRFDHRLSGSVTRKFVAGDHHAGGFVENDLRDLRIAYDGRWVGAKTRVEFGVIYKRLRMHHGWDDEGLQLQQYFGLQLPTKFQSADEQPLSSSYLSAERLLTGRLSVTGGLRYSSTGSLPGGVFAPRLRASYQLSDAVTLTAGTGRYAQHTVDARTGLGTGPEEFEIADGVPLFMLERPQEVWTYSLTADVRPSPAYRFRAAVYYRNFSRLARLQGAVEQPFPSFQFGRGRARGAHLLLEKRRGPVTFQLGYALAYPAVNFGEGWHPADWSIPHALKGMFGFQLGPWRMSVAGRYRSGVPYTPAAGRFHGLDSFQNRFGDPQTRLEDYFVLGKTNSARLPAYMRVDVALRRQYENPLFIWELYVQAINVLNTANTFDFHPRSFYQLYGMDMFEGQMHGLSRSLPIIPSIGAEISFK